MSLTSANDPKQTSPQRFNAVLGAPAFLSGLNETDLTFVKQRVEKHVAPEIAEARDATLKAVKEAEHGWQRRCHIKSD